MILQPWTVPISYNLYRLERTYSYIWKEQDLDHKIIVPKGFVFDGASAPIWTWSFTGIRPDGLSRAASLVHDYLYSVGGHLQKSNHKVRPLDKRWRGRNIKYTRKQCDIIFLNILRESGVALHKCHMMYYAVKLFGEKRWLLAQSQ